MDTALLAYSGISVRMLVDRNTGADHVTMFTVDYELGGAAQAHDHPFEEAYFFLAGEVEAELDGTPYTFEPGNVVFAGVGSVHGFYNVGTERVRWIETQAPQPPARHAYRWVQQLGALRTDALERREVSRDVVTPVRSWSIGGTRAIGLEIARHYAELGHERRDQRSRLTPRRMPRSTSSADERPGSSSTWPSPTSIAPALADVGPVRYLVLVAIDRDANSVADYDIGRAIRLVTLKLVGYTEVVHALRDRLHR